MNRFDRDMLIRKLQAEIAQTLLDMARRREELGDEAFEPVEVVRRDWQPPSLRPRQPQGETVEKRAVDAMVRQMHQSQPHHQTETWEQGWTRFVGQVVDERGYASQQFVDSILDGTLECLEQHKTVIEKQGDDVAALRAEMATLRERVDALENSVADQAAQLDALQADLADVERGNVAPLKRTG